jgi:hypothetical protein
VPTGLRVRPDGKLLAVSFADAQLELWTSNGEKLATVGFPATGEWIVAASDGEFDATERGWRAASWRLGGGTRDVEPVEKYFEDFYYRGLLEEILAGTYRFKAVGELAKLDREPPRVRLELIETTPASAALTPEGLVQRPGRIRMRVTATPNANGSVAGLAITQNDIVVQKWVNSRTEHAPVSEEVSLPLLPEGNRVTAYAFNSAGIRSEEEVWERPMSGFGYQVRPATLRALIIAVGDYPSPELRLAYPARDAMLVRESLTRAEKQWPAVSGYLSAPQRARESGALSQSSSRLAPARLDVVQLVDGTATRAAILSALEDLVARTNPEDVVLIYYSGHGAVADDHFYMVPSDAPLEESPAKWTSNTIRQAASALVSDTDIELALRSLHAQQGAIVVDACRASIAFAGAERSGLLRVEGLGRLGYEKGLHLLAGAQDGEPAVELRGLGHGALTYALFQQGLIERKADIQPVDGFIELGEWLRYGASAVRDLTAGPAGRTLQTPRLLPRRRGAPSSILLSPTR